MREAARNLTKAVKAREDYISIVERGGANVAGEVYKLIKELLCLFDLRLSEKNLDMCKTLVQHAYDYAVCYGFQEVEAIMDPIVQRFTALNLLSS